MKTDVGGALPEPMRARLIVELGDGPAPAWADAAVAPVGGAPDAADMPGVQIIHRWSPGRPAPAGAGRCVADGGLDAAASFARAHETLRVVPRAEVRRGTSRYAFTRANPGEGFSTYRLDPTSVAEFSVADDGRETPLADWLRRVAGLGFWEVWLHGVDAAAARRGFPIELVRKAHRLAPELTLWISGGGFEPRHFERLAREDGLAAVVVTEADFAVADAEAIIAALASPTLAAEDTAT